jgi:hypothetical protein
MSEEIKDPAAEKCSHDADDDVSDDAARTLAGNDHFGKRACDETDDDPAENCHEMLSNQTVKR